VTACTAGLVPAIHVFNLGGKGMDARHKARESDAVVRASAPGKTDESSMSDQPPERPAQSVDPKLLEILVCPLTKGPLEYDAARQELISRKAKLAYPIRDGIPIMLPEEARRLE
jgi:uncharacterized protein YbaR (Trm112 family)